MSWRCESCGSENVILERQDPTIDKPATFERICEGCHAPAPGITIRPAGMTYRLTTRKNWHPQPV
jgi:hypothetical protein